MLPDAGVFMIQGISPGSFGVQHFTLVDGEPLSGNRQIWLGEAAARALHKGDGDSLTLGGMRFRVTGIYASRIAWEQNGCVITLRDAQAFVGRPRQVALYGIQLHDPAQAPALVDSINAQYPELHASLSGDFAQQLPDLENTAAMVSAVEWMAVLVGGLGMMNTMLMSVLERTREIGVLRALGWRQRAVLALILRESFVLGLLGGLAGLALGAGLSPGAVVADGGRAGQPALGRGHGLAGSGHGPRAWVGRRAVPGLARDALAPVEALRYSEQAKMNASYMMRVVLPAALLLLSACGAGATPTPRAPAQPNQPVVGATGKHCPRNGHIALPAGGQIVELAAYEGEW
jgi:putative ABC transport system permease protein